MIVVNGRFLRRKEPTGIQVAAREFLDHARRLGLDANVTAPPGVEDPRVDRNVGITPQTRSGDLLWEQTVLPIAAGGDLVLSLANTAPVMARRAVVTVYDTGWLFAPERFATSMRLYGRLVTAAARRARAVVTCSEFSAGELRRLGIDSKTITVIPCAVDDGWGPAPAADVGDTLAALGIEPPYVLMVGWASPNRDVGLAVEAHLRALKEMPHQLVLTGPPGASGWRDKVPPDAMSIRRVDYVDRAALRALYTGAAALVQPSKYEGFGLPPLEAMGCGTPALVTDLPVLRETSGGQSEFIAADDVEGWTTAILHALRGEIEAGQPPGWTWSDASSRLVELLAPLQ